MIANSDIIKVGISIQYTDIKGIINYYFVK